jgi:hypothetical protein
MTSQMSDAPVWTVILRNVIISGLAGALFGCLSFPLFTAVLQIVERDNVLFNDYAIFDFRSLLLSTLTSPFLIYYILPLLLPLIGIACIAGVLFQKSIQKHLVMWCCLAPVSVWLTVIAILTQSPINSYYEQFTHFERFLINLSDTDHLIFLIASMFSAFVFYKLSRKGLKW